MFVTSRLRLCTRHMVLEQCYSNVVFVQRATLLIVSSVDEARRNFGQVPMKQGLNSIDMFTKTY